MFKKNTAAVIACSSLKANMPFREQELLSIVGCVRGWVLYACLPHRGPENGFWRANAQCRPPLDQTVFWWNIPVELILWIIWLNRDSPTRDGLAAGLWLTAMICDLMMKDGMGPSCYQCKMYRTFCRLDSIHRRIYIFKCREISYNPWFGNYWKKCILLKKILNKLWQEVKQPLKKISLYSQSSVNT